MKKINWKSLYMHIANFLATLTIVIPFTIHGMEASVNVQKGEVTLDTPIGDIPVTTVIER